MYMNVIKMKNKKVLLHQCHKLRNYKPEMLQITCRAKFFLNGVPAAERFLKKFFACCNIFFSPSVYRIERQRCREKKGNVYYEKGIC